MSSSMRKMRRFRFIMRMRKVLSGHLLLFDNSMMSNISVSGQRRLDQTARMRRLIWAFAVHAEKTRFHMARPIVLSSFQYRLSIWAVTQDLLQDCMYDQSSQSAWRALDQWLPKECPAKTQIRLRSAQSDLSLRWAHMQSYMSRIIRKWVFVTTANNEGTEQCTYLHISSASFVYTDTLNSIH